MELDVDLGALRAGRLARLQAAMRAHHMSACLLFNEPNIRYATGASAMRIYEMSTFVRCALVPAEGRPIVFEHTNSMHRSRQVVEDVRPMHGWEFYDDPAAEATIWAGEIVGTLRELAAGSPLAVDRLGTPVEVRDDGPRDRAGGPRLRRHGHGRGSRGTSSASQGRSSSAKNPPPRRRGTRTRPRSSGSRG
jgi:Xaa-Pro aminopeptidase